MSSSPTQDSLASTPTVVPTPTTSVPIPASNPTSPIQQEHQHLQSNANNNQQQRPQKQKVIDYRHSGPRLNISTTAQMPAKDYSHIPQSRQSNSRQAMFILIIFLSIIAIALFGLAFALWSHPAWGNTFEKRLPEILRIHHERQKQHNEAVVPIAHEFQLTLPPNYDVMEKAKSRVRRVPWLPSFRKAKSGVEKVHFRDQSIPPRLVSWSVISEGRPRALLINGTLTPEEAQSIIDTAQVSLARSKVISGNHGEEDLNTVRTSSGMFMISEHDRNLRANKILREVVGAMGGIPQDDWIEATQVLQYQRGQRYLAHPDFYSDEDIANLNRGGQRLYTVLTWLNVVNSGGSTSFPNAKLSVKPHPFGSILFYDVDQQGNVDYFSQHSGDPPDEGSTKFVAVNWCHGMPFY